MYCEDHVELKGRRVKASCNWEGDGLLDVTCVHLHEQRDLRGFAAGVDKEAFRAELVEVDKG